MPVSRWIVCPMVTLEQSNGRVRVPAIALLPDRGRKPVPELVDDDRGHDQPTGRWLTPTFADWSIVDGGDQERCLVFVRCADPSTIDEQCAKAPDEWLDLTGDLQEGDLARTPRELDWSAKDVSDTNAQVELVKGSREALTADDPLHKYVTAVGRHLNPSFTSTRGTWVPEIPTELLADPADRTPDRTPADRVT